MLELLMSVTYLGIMMAFTFNNGEFQLFVIDAWLMWDYY
jgi:hypothetical protein